MNTPELGLWLQRFFREYLPSQRNVSHATLVAYRDTFRLLVRFLQKSRHASAGPLTLEVLTVDSVVRFLDYLEQQRGNTIQTRNARLAAIRSFVNYVNDWLAAELPACVPRILTVPFKRFVRPMVGFLSPQEVQAILAATDDTWTGRRDRLLFQLLYNTGARTSEILSLRVKDINLSTRQVEVLGKGRRHRSIPLWHQTQTQLRRWIKENSFPADAPLLPNRFGERLSPAGAAYQLRRSVDRASKTTPSLKKRRISPHWFRHSTAMAMLEAGISLEVIALFLGHESPATTHRYLEASLAMKKQALGKIPAPKIKPEHFRPTDALLQFLESL